MFPVRGVSHGVPQGSILGPLLFIMYTSDLIPLVLSHGLHVHMFADDIQIYGSDGPSQTSDLSSSVSRCIDDVIAWCSANHLLLNPSKCEFIWLSSSRRKHCLSTAPIRVGISFVTPSTSVRVLGFYLDNDLYFRHHVSKSAALCFSVLRQIRSIRKSLPQHSVRLLVSSLDLTRFDFCASVLSGISCCLLS